jgi:hypothetical protein
MVQAAGTYEVGRLLADTIVRIRCLLAVYSVGQMTSLLGPSGLMDCSPKQTPWLAPFDQIMEVRCTRTATATLMDAASKVNYWKK